MPTLPTFLQSDAPPPPQLDLAEVGGGAAQTRTVPVPALMAQEETNWCWAAVTQYVFGIVRQETVSQQDVASKHIQNSGRAHSCAAPHRKKVGGKCADTGCSGACNAQHTLRIVLSERGFSGLYLSQKRAPTFDELKGEIDSGRPVPCRVRWADGAGHFVLVVGWTVDAAGTPLVHVRDPGSATLGAPISELIMPHSKFAADYRLSGLRGKINFSYKVG